MKPLNKAPPYLPAFLLPLETRNCILETGDYTDMARVTCAISGLTFSADHGPLTIKAEDGYFHPIFALPYKKLYGLYARHFSGKLTDTDSYLLFLAFLHSTDKINWQHPVQLDPTDRNTILLIDSNIERLVRVIQQTALISIPSFTQPSFIVRKENSSLQEISAWITAWEDNITLFREGYASQKLREDLQKIENKLAYYIKSGMSPEQYSATIANWADKIADFPQHKKESWKKIIRSCFNTARMFSTSLADLKELKEYCECNIEAGSIHFHTLMEVLKEGISRNINYLGATTGSLGYTLLPLEASKEEEIVESIIAKAPQTPPSRLDYTSDADYLKAKLRYKLALSRAIDSTKINGDL